MKYENGEKVDYTAKDTSEPFECCGLSLKLIDPLLINYGICNTKPKKFSIRDEKNDTTLFNLVSTMFQMKNFKEYRFDKAMTYTFYRPRYSI